MLRKNKLILSAAKSRSALQYLILFSIFIGFTLYSQPFTKEEKEILEMLDKRNSKGINFDFNNINRTANQLIYSKHFLSIINLGDTLLVDSLIFHYNTSDIDNKANILRLLGYLNSLSSREFLLSELYKEKNKDLLFLNAISLGKIGLSEDINDIFSFKGGLDSSGFTGSFTSAKFNSLFQYAARRITNEIAYSFMKAFKVYVLIEAGLDYYASYILNRTGNKDNLSGLRSEIIALTKSPSYANRMWAFSTLGKLQDTSTVDKMLYELGNESDWRVKVSICNALGNQLLDLNSPLTDKTVTSLLQHAVEDQSSHVSIVAWQALGKLFAGADTRNPHVRKIQQEILFILTPGKAIDWQIKTEAIRTYAKIFRDEVKDELFSIFNSTDNYDIKSAIVGSFGFMESGLVYKELRDSVSADVQRYNVIHPNKDGSMIGSNELAKLYRAFVDALTSLDDKLDADNKNIIRLILSEFSSSKDPILADNCLTNLQDSMYLQYRDETCQVMKFDYQSFTLPKDRDVVLMFIQAWDNMKYDGAKEILTANLKNSDYDIAIASANALKSITGKDYEKEITAPKYRTDFDWGFIDKLDEKKFAAIKTNKGIIKIVLLTENAPFTVQNFVKLSEKGYYNNTIFHRVVPNFVIQGGDPTGTGYGGPGYSIRSEFSPLSFDAYTVGMASSGKDTEGSQFFITHSPQPHLDGKYTLFGSVVEGFDVVDNIQIGDVIESVTFSSH